MTDYQPPTREQAQQAAADALRDVAYTCGRVWEGWQVGTMSQDYFAPAWEDDELTGSIADAVLALFPQPTPAPLIACLHWNCGWERGEVTMRRGCTACEADARDAASPAEPVSIAEMAPGTTFRARLREGLGSVDRFWFVSHVTYHRPNVPRVTSADGDRWLATCIDPSTIRDVTPPPVHG